MSASAPRPVDAVLRLLDRQVEDADGLLVCKVDDLEVLHRPGNALTLTAILTGRAALIPRLGGPVGRQLLRTWCHWGEEQAGRELPGRIGLDVVREVDSGISLSDPRPGVVKHHHPDPPPGTRKARLSDLLRMRVVGEDGSTWGRILDLRVGDLRVPTDELPVTGLVVGHGRPGWLLGYDRDAERGPWLVRRVVRRVHRDSCYVDASQIASVEWSSEVIRVSGEKQPLRRP